MASLSLPVSSADRVGSSTGASSSSAILAGGAFGAGGLVAAAEAGTYSYLDLATKGRPELSAICVSQGIKPGTIDAMRQGLLGMPKSDVSISRSVSQPKKQRRKADRSAGE